MSDEQAMWRVQMHDDASAFAELVRRWQEPVQRLCTRMTGDSHRAEDLTQEAFTRVFARRKVYQASSKFSTYLWRVALNLCYDELRRTRRYQVVSFDAEPTGTAADRVDEPVAQEPGPADAALASEQAELVRQALLRLPESHRSVIVLRHYHDLKFREIAEVLGIPEGTVKSRTMEALGQLARLLRRTLNDNQKDISSGLRSSRLRESLVI
jgi:RNA polymerase sigma-70 factor (ECF subfamily)